jgi:hypothetical protein
MPCSSALALSPAHDTAADVAKAPLLAPRPTTPKTYEHIKKDASLHGEIRVHRGCDRAPSGVAGAVKQERHNDDG